jgi:hypothetical protein
MMLRNTLGNALLTSVKSLLPVYSVFARRMYSSAPSLADLSPNERAEAEERTRENNGIAMMAKQAHEVHNTLKKLIDLNLVPDELQERTKRVLHQHTASFKGIFQAMIQERASLIEAYRGIADMLKGKRERALIRRDILEKEIANLAGRSEEADFKVKQHKQSLYAAHDSDYVKEESYDKASELLLDETLKFNESCDVVAAVIAAANNDKQKVELDEPVKRYVSEHAANVVGNLQLQVWANRRIIKDSTSSLAIMLDERILMADRLKVMNEEISSLENLVSKLSKQVDQLKEIDLMTQIVPESESLLESSHASVTKLGKI